jgi:hypothetical protein
MTPDRHESREALERMLDWLKAIRPQRCLGNYVVDQWADATCDCGSTHRSRLYQRGRGQLIAVTNAERRLCVLFMAEEAEALVRAQQDLRARKATPTAGNLLEALDRAWSHRTVTREAEARPNREETAHALDGRRHGK